ncbi:hypothetical protein UY3_08941 [Chelonia mydas]|uniref:Uncharacterized protein n=1 Tax=Chelonia mydas TaxID=8469 RepID=M7B9U5_CHEMY|nr:hypothetical protein UY3_08941 [Chelonia mydas]
MTERGHDQDTLQRRVKVKELQNAYHKAREANHCSAVEPTSCWFYKELDVILSGDPTSTAKAPVDTSLARVPVESGSSQQEEILDEDVEGEGDPEAGDDSEVRDAYSQDLFSTPEEPSQSQLSEIGKAQTGEEAAGTITHFKKGKDPCVGRLLKGGEAYSTLVTIWEKYVQEKPKPNKKQQKWALIYGLYAACRQLHEFGKAQEAKVAQLEQQNISKSVQTQQSFQLHTPQQPELINTHVFSNILSPPQGLKGTYGIQCTNDQVSMDNIRFIFVWIRVSSQYPLR